tara:strand:+ start:19262 stop:19666 length:405 start_codon:yes stop_codon:yes gene_type:complete
VVDQLFEGEEDIRNLFRKMLGSDIIIKDNISENEEKLFILFVQQLESAKKLEDETTELGLEVRCLVDPLWIVIENLLKLQFGLDTTQLIMFYLYERFNPDGTIIALEDEETGKKYILKEPKDLFSYIKFRYSGK